MKTRFRLIRCGIRGGLFYCVDTHTRKRVSLRTHDEDSAKQIVLAKNQAERQPVLNLQIAKAYIAGTDSGIATRTWQKAMDALIATKEDANQLRWQSAAKDKALKPLLSCVIIETSSKFGRLAGFGGDTYGRWNPKLRCRVWPVQLGYVCCPRWDCWTTAKLVSHQSERPIQMIWRLAHPMPAEMFEENRRGG